MRKLKDQKLIAKTCDHDSPTTYTRVLLAEDDDEMRALLTLSLREGGFDVTECKNGVCLARNLGSLVIPEASREFDLIISDIHMPGINGLDAIELLHYHAGLPPTIFITAFGDQEIHDRAREIGAIAVFNKPFEIDDLIRKAQEIINHN